MRIETLDIEHGRPNVDEARPRLAAELAAARSRGVAVLKLIHGYGSSGRGGRLRTALRTTLAGLQKDRSVGAVVPGEAWSIFEADARALLDRYPQLRRDADLERGNAGITLVELRRA